MKNLEEMWTRIGSVTKNEVITAVLKDEIELFKSRIEPHDTGHLYTTIGTLEHRFEELDNDDVDYPDYIHPVASDVNNKKALKGIIICGSGNGAAMTANKYKKIRAALCWNVELSKLSRLHNNANIISLPARFVTIEKAIEIVEMFLKTDYEGGRHQKRIEKIPCE